MPCSINKIELINNGFSIIENLYSENEITQILSCIDNVNYEKNSVVKTKDLFAIRQLIKRVPQLSALLFNDKLTQLISQLSSSNYFLSKAIYFDKPPQSNWFVSYHQDLTISVDKKVDCKGYVNWTSKKGQYGVQPPIEVLQDTITIRIHLDDTDKNNGALKVIPKSHLKGIIRTDSEEWNTEQEFVCTVKKGGVMLMKPLILHASNRTTNKKKRRVIHLEFNNHKLPEPLSWIEFLDINTNVQQS